MGTAEYEPIARRYRVPVVVTGSEPLDLLEGVLRTMRQLEAGRAEVKSQYGRPVQREGNPQLKRLIEDVFEVCDQNWRGVGLIPKSGFPSTAQGSSRSSARGVTPQCLMRLNRAAITTSKRDKNGSDRFAKGAVVAFTPGFRCAMNLLALNTGNVALYY
jgi:hypothetical protein